MTVAAQALVWLTVMVAGEQATVTEAMVGGVTVTIAEPDLVVSCVEVAMSVALVTAFRMDVGVKTPEALTAPALVGLTAQVTLEL